MRKAIHAVKKGRSQNRASSGARFRALAGAVNGRVGSIGVAGCRGAVGSFNGVVRVLKGGFPGT